MLETYIGIKFEDSNKLFQEKSPKEKVEELYTWTW